MAEDSNLEIEDGKKSKKKLIIIIVVIVIAIAAGAWFFLMSGSEEPAQTPADETAVSQPDESDPNVAKVGTALYVAMPRPFVFNVPGATRDRVVQIKVQLLVRGEVNEEITKKHIPLIEGTLLGVFSTTTADELGTSQGKESLRATALEKVQTALNDVEGSKVIEQVLFTGFVMQ